MTSYWNIEINNFMDLIFFTNNFTNGFFGYFLIFIPYLILILFFDRRLNNLFASISIASIIISIVATPLAIIGLINANLIYLFVLIAAALGLILYLRRD